MNLIQLLVFHLVLFASIGLLLAVLLVINRVIQTVRDWLPCSNMLQGIQQTLVAKRPRQLRSHASH